MKKRFKKKLEKFGKILLTLAYSTYYFLSPAATLIVHAASSGDIENSPIVATNGKGENDQGYIKVTKTIERDDNDPEGVYTVKFNIVGKNYESTHQVPSYTIFVMDASDSMDDRISTGWFSGTTRFEQARDAIKAASAKLVENPNGKVALIEFGTDSDPAKIVGFQHAAFSNSDFKQSWGGTNYDAALMNAKNLLNTVINEEGVKNIIFISDGKPTVGLVKHQTISDYDNWWRPSSYTYESYFDDYYYSTSDGTTYLNSNTIKNVTIQGFTSRESGTSNNSAKANFNDINYTRNNTLPLLKSLLKGSNNDPHNNIYSFSYMVTATDEQNILKKIATTDENGNARWKNVDANSIVTELERIADEISSAAAGVDATLNDEVGADFSVINNGNFEVIEGDMSYHLDSIPTGEGETVSFKIKINPYASTGYHETNGDFELKYKENASDTEYKTVSTDESPRIYWVAKESKVTVNYYLDGTTTPVATSVQSDQTVVTNTDGTRNTYVAPVADVYGYTFDKTKTEVKDGSTTVASSNYSVDDNGQATVLYYIDGTTVNYYYTKNDATVTDPTASKTGDDSAVKKSITDEFNYQINYNTKIEDYVGDVTVTITDTLPYSVQDNDILDGGTLSNNNQTITWTETIAVDENHQEIKITKNIKVHYSEIDNATVTNNVQVEVKQGNKSVDNQTASYTNTVGEGTVVVAHQDTKGNTLVDSDTYYALAGTQYNHQNEDKTIYGYTVKSRTPDKSVGTFNDGTITIIYVYDKNAGTVVDGSETLTKTATPTTNTYDGNFGYKLSYRATVRDYVGTATLIIKDTPQYKIDTTKTNNFGGGVYDPETNTITWTITTDELGENNTQIVLDLTYNVYYNPDEVEYDEDGNAIINNATSELTRHGEEDEKTTKTASATVNLKVSNITEVYKSGNTVLDTKGPSTNLVNKSYTMEEKEFYGYTHESHDKVITAYQEDDVVITHNYTKNDPTITDDDTTLTKSGDTDVKAINDRFNYTISYETEVTDYVGTITATVTDTLPYAAKNTSNFDGGEYDAQSNTIKWTEDFEIAEGQTTISITKNITIDYEGIDSENVVNNVQVELKEGNQSLREDTASYENTIAKTKVHVNHVDQKTGEPLATVPDQEGLAGKDYTTEPVTIYGYEVVNEHPEKYAGQFAKEDITVTYEYKNKAGNVDDNVTKTNPQVESLLDEFEYRITYNATVSEYVGTATLIIKDTPQYKIDVNKNNDFAGGVYDEATNTITWTVNDNNLDADHRTIVFDKTIKIYYVVDTITTGIKNTVTSTLTYGTETSDDEYTTDEVEVNKSNVYTAYVDKDTELEISSSDLLINDYIGKSYDATGKAKDIQGYTWDGENPTNISGSIAKADTIVVFKYTKNIGTVENEEYTKELSNSKEALASLENGFSYQVTYSADIVDFAGTATLTVTDTPSVAIDTAKANDFAGGTYDEATNTITWTVTKEVTEDTSISFDKTITVFYKIDEVNGPITNKANFKLDLDNNNITDEDVEITDEVKKSSIEEVYVYMDGETEVELDRTDKVTDYVGKSYTSTVKEFYGYTWKETQNDTDKFKENDVTIKHIYTKNLGTVEDEEYTKTTTDKEVSTASLENGFSYNLKYEGTVKDFVGTATLIVTDTPNFKIDTTKANDFAGGTYDETTNTITWTLVVENITKETVVRFNKDIKVYYTPEEVTGTIINNANFKLDLDNNNITDDDTSVEDEVKKSHITEQYIYDTGRRSVTILDEKGPSEGYVGSPYEMEIKTFYGYTYLETENETNKYLSDDTIIKHYYTKNPGEITDEEPVKTAPESVESVNSAFDYTLSYSATLKDFVGTASTTFVDTLPYKIDVEKSELDGGVYDEEAMTITWAPVETEINEKNQTISITKNITLYYLDIDSSEVTNDFNVETNYDANTSKTDTDASTEVKEGKVIVHHVDMDRNTLAEDEEFTGLVGTSYKTSAKEFADYYLEDFEGEPEGEYIDGTKEVTYIYDLSGQGDIEPPQTGFEFASLLGAYAIRYTIILVTAILITRKRKHA